MMMEIKRSCALVTFEVTSLGLHEISISQAHAFYLCND